MARGEMQEAAEQLEQEVEVVGPGFITLSALGRAELALERYEEAASHLEAAMGLNPYNSPIAMQLADAYTRLGYHIKACDILSRILAIDPGNMPLRFKFANCLYRAERYVDALSHFKDLHKFDPANADFLLNMGTVYAAMDSLDRAIEVWEKALVLDPQNEMARDNLRTARE
jgi:tetratricopeptide (TPR) repeat protein